MVTQAIPNKPDELREFLADKVKVQEAFATPEKAAEFIEKYRDAANNADPEIKEQLSEQVKQVAEKFLKDNGYKVLKEGEVERPKRLPMSEKAVAPNKKALGAELDGQFEDMADYAKAIFHRIKDMQADTRLKDMSEMSGGDGGFLVPEEFRAELLRLAIETAIIRPRARVIPMGSASVKIPAIKDTSHASTIYGGVSASWIAEAGDLSTVTQPLFTQILLTARKLTGYTVASNELLTDSAISMGALIDQLFADALSYFEDDAFFSGTGAGQPLGILNADALVTVAKETGQSAASILWENIVNMYSRMLPQSLNRAVWIVNSDTFPQLATMSLNVGTGGSAIWLNNGAAGPPMTILGRPVIMTEKAETLGTAGDIYFTDLSYYLIGDRQAMTMMASPHVRFDTDEMTWRFTQRVDGRPWIQSALTPRNGTSTVSPFVNLATRA